MHDLLRLHATELARDHHTPADRGAALRRVADFYVHTARLAGHLLAPQSSKPTLDEPAAGQVTEPLTSPASALAWFDAEHACLLATQQLAHAHGWDAHVYHLAWALDPYHRHRGHIADQPITWHLAVTAADRLPDPDIRAHAHQMLGDAYAQIGRTTDALDHLNQALALAQRTEDLASQAHIHHSLGGTWDRHGDLHKALEHAHQALRIFQTLDNAFGHARALNGIGWLQAHLGHHGEAHAYCEAALTLLRQQPTNHRQLGESNTLDSLGYIAFLRHDHEQALDYYQEALTICRTQGHDFLQAHVLYHIGETQLAQHNIDQARDTWKQALDLYTTQHRLADASHVAQKLATIEQNPEHKQQ